MSIPSRLSSYLNKHDVRYDVTMHKLSRTSAETARTAHIQPHDLAKSVVLEHGDGYVMALIPADRTLMIGQLAQLLGRRDLHLADEAQIAMRFDGCDAGAVPSIGMAWGVETVVDEALEASDTVFLECGDHERLLRLSHDQFHRLMQAQRHGRLCKTPLH